MIFRQFIITLTLSLVAILCTDAAAESFQPEQALVVIQTDSGQGTGFIATIGGTNFIITNTHVLSATTNFDCYTVSGRLLSTGRIEFEANNDLARIIVNDFDGEPFRIRATPAPRLRERITVYGNSKGAGVVTEISGQVLGSGPAEVEVSAEFVEGNSGSPIVDEDGLVIGVATYISESEATWVSKDTRFDEARRMGIRLNHLNNSWIPVKITAFYKQSCLLYDINTLINHFADVQKFMFTEKERRIEKLTSRTYLKVKETRWTDIGYTDKASDYYRTTTWHALLKELCDAHDELTKVRYEGKKSMKSHQVEMLMSRLNKSLQNIQQLPRSAIKSTAWVTPFYKLCGDDLLERMSLIDQGAGEISKHFNEGWK